MEGIHVGNVQGNCLEKGEGRGGERYRAYVHLNRVLAGPEMVYEFQGTGHWAGRSGCVRAWQE